jgi:hypothetical protein
MCENKLNLGLKGTLSNKNNKSTSCCFLVFYTILKYTKVWFRMFYLIGLTCFRKFIKQFDLEIKPHLTFLKNEKLSFQICFFISAIYTII